jgi:hypothetical protein
VLLNHCSRDPFIKERIDPHALSPNLLSPKDKDNLFNLAHHFKGPLLSNSFFEPIIKTKVLINQKIPHAA